MEIGTVLSLPGAALAELAGTAFDFAWIDLEHGALGLGDMQAMAVGLAAAGCAAHVRLPTSRAECSTPGSTASWRRAWSRRRRRATW
jgi:2-keto-3-deoxy-L-rhamnonate aldolase RhmA